MNKNYNIMTRDDYSGLTRLVAYAFHLSYERDKDSAETEALLSAYRKLLRDLPHADKATTKQLYQATRGNLI